MKFQLLPIGARFEFEGKCYTKASPLVAAEDGGGQRMIARYAVLHPLRDDRPVRTEEAEPEADMAEVLNAFAVFEATVTQLLREACGADIAQFASLQTTLATGARIFRNRINSK